MLDRKKLIEFRENLEAEELGISIERYREIQQAFHETYAISGVAPIEGVFGTIKNITRSFGTI